MSDHTVKDFEGVHSCFSILFYRERGRAFRGTQFYKVQTIHSCTPGTKADSSVPKLKKWLGVKLSDSLQCTLNIPDRVGESTLPPVKTYHQQALSVKKNMEELYF